MSRRKTLTIMALDLSLYDIDGDTLDGLIELLEDAWEKIPGEFRPTAKVDLVPGWEDGFTGLRVEYERPETDDEVNKRLEEAAQYEAATAALVEKTERQQLEKLLKKYGAP